MIITRYLCLVRGVLWTLLIRLLGGRVGRGLMVDRGVTFRYLPTKRISIGSNVYLGRGVVIDVNRRAELTLGPDVLISHFTVVAASASISIGASTQIAELCSIRDSDHGMEPGQTIRSQPLRSSPVTLGEDVWIGRGSAILRGASVGSGTVVGANSLVKGAVDRDLVVAGSPLRTIRSR